MSGALDVLQMKEVGVLKFLVAGTHLVGTNLDFQMEQRIYKRKSDGSYIINLRGPGRSFCWQLDHCAIENPADISVLSSRNPGQRAALKLAVATGAAPIAASLLEPSPTWQPSRAKVLVVTDPRADHQPLTEASYVNPPTIALRNTDSPLHYVDIAIPCSNKGPHSVGLTHAWHHLREHPWEGMPDFYFYRDPEETEKAEQPRLERLRPRRSFRVKGLLPSSLLLSLRLQTGLKVFRALSPIQHFPTEDWSAQPPSGDWSAAPPAQAIEWVGTATEWS